MMSARFLVARGAVLWLFKRFGIAALTTPWRAVYMHPDYWDHPGLRRHELVHVEQIQRDGAIRFTVRYLYWLCRYGYWRNPYEVEAYSRAPLVFESNPS